ncbi:MAG TPA: hypothetical protein EYG86_10015 [Crocinitomicaceae bacterium]|nr:hypothetical protein [Crocinitomicaceae bacterium]
MSFWTPEIPTDNYLEKGRFILAWRLAVVTSVLFVLLTINFSNSLFHFITYLVCLGLAIGSLILLHYAKSARGVYLMAATVGTVIVSYNLIYLNDIYQVSNIIWKVFIITYTFFGLGKKWGVVVLFANLLALVYYSLITVNYNISSIPNLDLFGRISLAIELTIVTSLTTYVIYQFVQINSKSHGELISANKKLQERNATKENSNFRDRINSNSCRANGRRSKKRIQ